MSESRLLAAFRENERDLVQFLVQRLKSTFTAQDLVQDLYVRIRTLDPAPSVSNHRAYLFRMAANLATDHQRREKRHAELQAEAQSYLTETADTRSPERLAQSRAELARMARALDVLPPTTRRIFELNRFEEKSHREIAEIVGLSPTAVFKHIRRAVDHLARSRDG